MMNCSVSVQNAVYVEILGEDGLEARCVLEIDVDGVRISGTSEFL
jgi:hypothetical protein